MKPYNEVEHLCTGATLLTSPVNGWAWRAVGRGKAMDEGDDESAAICFQQALRCRDIESRTHERLGFFFRNPTIANGEDTEESTGLGECGETWSNLAGCYRRLGKFSASLRAYTAANDASNDNFPPAILCAWAHGASFSDCIDLSYNSLHTVEWC